MKYKLTDKTKTIGDITLHQIQCVKPFDNITKGAIGGWIESKNNLSQQGDAWVSGNEILCTRLSFDTRKKVEQWVKFEKKMMEAVQE